VTGDARPGYGSDRAFPWRQRGRPRPGAGSVTLAGGGASLSHEVPFLSAVRVFYGS
jgi:hypothetical protein